MSLLRAGAARSVIALFPGHERVETTTMYLHAEMQLKEQALAKACPTIQRYLDTGPATGFSLF